MQLLPDQEDVPHGPADERQLASGLREQLTELDHGR